MGIKPAILDARVMHKRHRPKVNQFIYNSYYLALDLSDLKNAPVALNRFSHTSLYFKDHGDRSGENPKGWARQILRDYKIENADGRMILITMPRSFGYVFNPVSFYLCFDRREQLRAYICEVNNTFGETHSYVCARHDGKPIDRGDILKGEKFFHVSPFIERQGVYEFRIAASDKKFGVWIDHFIEGQKILSTSLTGDWIHMTQRNVAKYAFIQPMVSLKTVFLIHWQACKLWLKKIRYIKKPQQNNQKISGTESN